MRAALVCIYALFSYGVAHADYPSMIIIITHDDVETHNLDSLRELGINGYSLNIHGPAKLMKRLNDNVSTDEEQLKKEIIGKISTITEEEKLSFFRPSILIKQLGIKKLPVVIFNNGEEIIYGVTDFLDALDIWEETR